MKLNGKVVDLQVLGAELEAADIPILGLGTVGDDVFTYDEDGAPAELPAGSGGRHRAHVRPEIVSTKNDLLLLLLADVVPGEEDTEVLTLVLQEMLRP
jgi:hypothetical protein